MSIQPVLKMGHPDLRKTAKKVPQEDITPEKLAPYIVDLKDTMAANQGIGIAATQIGLNLQIALIDIPDDDLRYGQNQQTGLIVIVNPVIEILDHQLQGFWEGCLSVPGIRGYVERPRKLRLSYQNQSGETCELIAEGFMATVVAHELDHLFGRLFIDKITRPTDLSFQEEYERFHQQI